MSLYTLKRRLRKSLFATSSVALPTNWIESTTTFRRRVFSNSETSESTSVDPRMRAFPEAPNDLQTGLLSNKYMNEYNAGRCSCDGDWGHSSRRWTVKPRHKPTLYCILFIGLAAILFYKGERAVFGFPYLGKELVSLPDVTVEDFLREIRLGYLKIALTRISVPIVISVLFGCLGILLSDTHWWALSFLENTEKVQKKVIPVLGETPRRFQLPDDQ